MKQWNKNVNCILNGIDKNTVCFVTSSSPWHLIFIQVDLGGPGVIIALLFCASCIGIFKKACKRGGGGGLGGGRDVDLIEVSWFNWWSVSFHCGYGQKRKRTHCNKQEFQLWTVWQLNCWGMYQRLTCRQSNFSSLTSLMYWTISNVMRPSGNNRRVHSLWLKKQ